MIAKINPYPGLRPFTEEESIFFKGRDVHIRQIITQLQDKKIVIVTGASGAGKSSLIFAGVVPNARAGFFKALYNNWLVVSFRPERAPLHNLSNALANELNINFSTIYSELQYGFSALVNIYKNSKFFIPLNDKRWDDPEERKKIKSQGANLLIIADQFEEFFTNPENFPAGKPSTEAYTTVNLLLETATLSLKENLPIYIIFTMRSDFISDCVAFKGLPEFIGFSQFFVPRLKRHELQQVIEEPAKLAGGSVSKRLTEILINQLYGGFDQLPILQHALNQLWQISNFGQEQIDLIHLAKLAGIHKAYLDKNSKQIFDAWYQKLPEKEKKYFVNPSISNVLNYHANKLYESAYEYFLNNAPWAKKNITEQEAKEIIKKAFLALTRIDQGRAVRNRMTLKEITHIINNPKIDYTTVNGVLNIFREPNNTFIRPFIDPNDITTQYISADTVLDITHESLIRNWELLQRWEIEEEENVNDFFEFKVQVQRWINSGKSKEYLLPLGPLTYYEQWYERCKPNKYWIAKYDKSNLPKEQKLKNAEIIAEQIKEYLTESRKYIEAQEKRKKTIRLAGAIISFLIILILSATTLWAIKEKQNADRQRQIAEKQRIIAEKAKKEAELAKAKAEQEKQRAEIQAKIAIEQKRKADSTSKIALMLKEQATINYLKAQKAAQDALKAKQRADSLRQIAEIQKQKAIEASKEAQRLSYLSIAQSLAFKATQKYEDPQLNLLLAYYAYILNKLNNGYIYDPVIYQGLMHSYFSYNNIKPIHLSDKTIKDFFLVDTNSIIYITIDNEIFNFNLNTLQQTQIQIPKDFHIQKIEKAKFINKNQIIASDIQNSLFLIDLKNSKIFKLIEGVRLRDVTCSGENIFTLFTNGKFIHWKVNPDSLKIKIIHKYSIPNTKPRRILFNPINKSEVILISLYGGIWTLNMHTAEIRQILKPRNSSLYNLLTSATVDLNGKFIALGFADGEIILYDLKNKKIKDKISISNSAVRHLKFDKKTEKLIAVSPDNTINIFIIKNFHNRPISINPLNGKVLQLHLINNSIFALYENQSLLEFYTEPEIYAKLILSQITRDLTDEEWKQFIGENVPRNNFTLKKLKQ